MFRLRLTTLMTVLQSHLIATIIVRLWTLINHWRLITGYRDLSTICLPSL
uniref:Uncharacterized protein n=1 Tax=Brassica campestris TaxID=3711 RepID=A0A3P5ZU15_BRACM|nr:unnamed protein product [Brassica rapa]